MVDEYQDREADFVAAAATEPDVTYEYFAARIELESIADSVEPDDVRARNAVSLCRAFISVFPQLEAAESIGALGTEGIYKQACRSLQALIVGEISRSAESPCGREALGGVIDDGPDLDTIIGRLVRHCPFSERFIGYCDDYIEYARKLSSRRSLFDKALGTEKESKARAELAKIMQNHRDAMKSG